MSDQPTDQPQQGAGQTRGEQAGAPIASEAPGETPSSDIGSRAVADSADRRDVSEPSRDDLGTESAPGGAHVYHGGGEHEQEQEHEDEHGERGERGEHAEDDQRDEQGRRIEEDEQREAMQEEFAREHDPEQHDLSAGEEFRQEGDWTADDAGGPQVWDSDGNLVEGSLTAGSSDSGSSNAGSSDSGSSNAGSPRTSSLDEVRDGGYGVGSAAPLDDGATPLGHPVKAWEDTKTYVTPDHHKYGEAEPHVWFTDADAAQRAGFKAVD